MAKVDNLEIAANNKVICTGTNPMTINPALPKTCHNSTDR